MSSIALRSNSHIEARGPEELLQSILSEIKGAISGDQTAFLLPTGYVELDSLLKGGLEKGAVSLVSGRPAMGKTTFILNLIRNMGQAGICVGLVCLESDGKYEMKRLLAGMANIDLHRLLHPEKFSREELEVITTVSEAAAVLPLWIHDIPMASPRDIRDAAIALKSSHMIDVLFIDGGIGALHSPIKEPAEIGLYIFGLKMLAQRLSIPIVFTCQLSRSLEEREELHPYITDVQNADHVLPYVDTAFLLHNENYYRIDTPPDNNMEITIWKRGKKHSYDGLTQCGSVRLNFFPHQCRLEQNSCSG